MPINSVHPSYTSYKEDAEYTKLFFEGEKAVKAAGQKLLPPLSGQSAARYKAYKDRAVVFGVVQRTVQALTATSFRKDPAFILPPALEYMHADCTGTGVPLSSFTMRLLAHLLVGGRAGILVDLPKDGGAPFLVLYDGDDLRNWSEESDFEFVVLENSSLVRDPDDKFNLVECEGWRELAIEGGEYVVRLWESDEKGKPFVAETSQPMKFGKPLNYLPFAPVSSFGVEYEVCTPPLLSLAQLAGKAYTLSADKHLALHVLAVPTPVIISDIDADSFGTLELGCDKALLLPAGSSASYLEFAGQGLGAIETAEQFLQDQMAALGAKMILGSTGNSTEKAAGVFSREVTSNSILVSVLTSMEAALNKSLKWAAEWVGADVDSAQFKISKELLTTTMDANMVTALTQAYLQGAIDLDVLFHNLSEGGFIPAETTKETFADNLKKQQAEALKREKSLQPEPAPVQTLDNTEKV
jgi:hypothetical protein